MPVSYFFKCGDVHRKVILCVFCLGDIKGLQKLHKLGKAHIGKLCRLAYGHKLLLEEKKGDGLPYYIVRFRKPDGFYTLFKRSVKSHLEKIYHGRGNYVKYVFEITKLGHEAGKWKGKFIFMI